MKTVAHSSHFARQGWYPGDAETCSSQLEQYLDELDSLPIPDQPLRAGIVPHAGWMFSGALAGRTIGALAKKGAAETVVLLGGHLGPRSPSWVLQEGVWETPIGDLKTDTELAAAIAEKTPLEAIGPAEYRPDNTIELQLPFLRYAFPEARLVTAGVPADSDCVTTGRSVVQAAHALGRKILVVGSTDLTHYGPNYGFSPAGSGEDAVRWVKEENDRRAVDLMQRLAADTLLAEALDKHFCCCPGATAATLAAARELGATQGHVLSTLTSYDVRPGSSFVGYASVVF
ncbi:MAG: AmmeMemoRadiSam system protein B [bacterium]